MSALIRVGPSMTLPIDAVTQTMAILAVRGAGKSYTAGVIAGEMLRLHQQVVVLDPTGAWYGLRSNAAGMNRIEPTAIASSP